MNHGHYSHGNDRQNLPQHEHVGYHRPQNPPGWREQEPQPLPPGWVEATDPSSGKVYYCNPHTRETKWERPTVLTTSTTVAPIVVTGNPSSHHNAPLSTWQQQQQQQQPQQQPLPPGWVETKDPNSGKVYFCNPITRETKWERPISTVSAPSTTRPQFQGNRNPYGNSSNSTSQDTNDNRISDTNMNHRASNQSMSSSAMATTATTTMTTTTGANNNYKDDSQNAADSNDNFDELLSLTTGQIAHLIKVQKLLQFAPSEDDRQVGLSTIVSSKSSQDSNETNNNKPAIKGSSKYVPIHLSFMASLSATERAEPGRLDVRMCALREELQKFG